MKKMLYGLLVLLSLLVVTACKEVTDDYNKSKKPAIVLKNQGQLAQIYDENSELEDVTFTVIFKNFEENEIDMDTVTIRWYIREILIESYNDLTEITQVVNAPGDISVRVEVTYVLNGETETLEDNALISVMKVPTQILITNSVDQSKHQVSVKLGLESQITFNGTITGNLNHSVVRWVIQRQTSSEPELYEDIVAELTKNGSVATTSLVYQFVEKGNYIVTLQTGEGQSQDANKYISNSIHINVNFGNFELLTTDSKVLSDKVEDYTRELVVTELDPQIAGDGIYEWYLNGEPLNHQGLTYTHDASSLGGYLYQVKFKSMDTSEILEVTNPVLIVNGIEVATEEELLTALQEQKEAIILTDDIEYRSESSPLVINYPTTIYGNGHELSSLEIQVFMSITSSDVKLSNLKISRAIRYNLMISNANNVYLENLVFDELGGGGGAGSFLDGEFGAALYINKSEVVVNNIEFVAGGLVGIRIDNDMATTPNKTAKLELIGSFKYPEDDPLLLPIGSGKSNKDGIEVIANGFDYFALPAGNITIRRWDNQGSPITWEIYDPQKTDYKSDEYLDLFGVGINIDISFLNLEFSGNDGLDFVKLYISMFKQYGKIEVTSMDNDDILKRYYVVGQLDSVVYGFDQLAYSLTPQLNIANAIEPKLDLEPGQYRVKVFIGEEFYLGHIIITVTEATE